MNSAITKQFIIENYKNPQNNFKPNQFSLSAQAKNQSCGDEIEIFLNIEKNQIQSIHYLNQSCAICQASASILSQELKNKPIKKILTMNKKDIEKILNITLSINRIKCALLPLEAIKKALKKN